MAEAKFDAARWTRNDRIVGIASLVVLISLFLPWFSWSYSALGFSGSYSWSGTSANGWLWLVFIICLAIIAYLVVRALYEEMPVKLPLDHDKLLFTGTAINFFLVLIAFFVSPGAGYSAAGVPGVGWAYGSFVALIAAIVAVAPYAYPFVKGLLAKKSA
jgi:hypothetical protein